MLLFLLPSMGQQPSLSFKSLDSGSINLSDYRGKVVIASFSAKGIPLTKYELPQLEKLAAKYADRDVVILWVSTNSNRPKVGNYASDDELKNISTQYPHLVVVRDPDEVAYRQIGANALPTIVLIDRKGRLFGSPRSGIDPQANLVNDLSPSINRLLSE